MKKEESGVQVLAHVLECLRRRLKETDAAILEGEKEIEDMHEYYWQNYTEMDQYGYENFDNQQALLSQVNANEEQLLRRRRFKRMLDSPFFGRVDFCYEGDDVPETFYIGIGNLSEETGGRPLVYDWRAPVSGLFYDYDRGPAAYEAPLGRLSGEITSKWQYKIRRGKMIYQFESDVKIDDDILKAELGSSGETKLKSIIRTIQKEQNAIIRNDRDRILVIQGAAGSGKTSVALHRIAWLLYHDRQNLKSSNILILSPNSVFSDYISRILPELGEENIKEMSFDLFAYRELRRTVSDCEERCDQIEREAADSSASKIRREKQSEEFIRKLDGFILRLEDGLMDFKDTNYRGMVLSEAELIRLFYLKFPDIPLLSRMDAVAEYFIDQVETFRDRDLREEDREELRQRFLRMYETRDLYVLYNRFLREEGYSVLPDLPPEKRKLKYEDVYPLLYLKYSLCQCRSFAGIRHLVVDEMQDYSRMQYMILQKLFPCRMTILGDMAQSMEEEQQDVTAFLPGILGRDIKKIIMDRSYRNTVEIAVYANRIAGPGGIRLFERHGKPVKEQSFVSMKDALDTVLKRWQETGGSYETAALILMTDRDAQEAAEYLKKRLRESGREKEAEHIVYVNRNSRSFLPGLTVTAFYLSKGLEFDLVFGLFDKEKENGLKKQARYIAATRALHELHMYAYGSEDRNGSKQITGFGSAVPVEEGCL